MLVGKDTDLIVLLCYQTSFDSHDIFFHLEPKKNMKKLCVWNIRATKEKLGQDKTSATTSSSSMLFLGKSRLYGIGKGTSLSKFKTSSMFREQAKVFHSDSASTHHVIDAGEKALVLVCNGMLTDTLDSLQHKRFCEKVASKHPT